MDWYVVINNNVTSITDIDAYKEYLINHNGQAPPIPEGVCSISESLFKNIDGIFNIYIPYSVKSLGTPLSLRGFFCSPFVPPFPFSRYFS